MASKSDGARSLAFFNPAQSTPGPVATVIDAAGTERTGVNFASQDYLGLAAHDAVRAAAIEALKDTAPYRRSADIAGKPTLSLRLQTALAELIGLPHVVLFPTGWAAGYGVITALITGKDHVVLDQYAHNCCVQGAMAATRNVQQVRHL